MVILYMFNCILFIGLHICILKRLVASIKHCLAVMNLLNFLIVDCFETIEL